MRPPTSRRFGSAAKEAREGDLRRTRGEHDQVGVCGEPGRQLGAELLTDNGQVAHPCRGHGLAKRDPGHLPGRRHERSLTLICGGCRA